MLANKRNACLLRVRFFETRRLFGLYSVAIYSIDGFCFLTLYLRELKVEFPLLTSYEI